MMIPVVPVASRFLFVFVLLFFPRSGAGRWFGVGGARDIRRASRRQEGEEVTSIFLYRVMAYHIVSRRIGVRRY